MGEDRGDSGSHSDPVLITDVPGSSVSPTLGPTLGSEFGDLERLLEDDEVRPSDSISESEVLGEDLGPPIGLLDTLLDGASLDPLSESFWLLEDNTTIDNNSDIQTVTSTITC